MPRPRRCRRVWFQPHMTYFKPAGIRLRELAETGLTVEELESLRLKDHLGLEQNDAAQKMGISQPTFHRMLQQARRKVAAALVEGTAIRIQGGDYRMHGPGRGPGRHMHHNRGFHRGFSRHGMAAPSYCVCPVCDHHEPKRSGVPCASIPCSHCGTRMKRGDQPGR